MPIMQSAKKKLRKDVKKEKINRKYKSDYEKIMRSLKKNKAAPDKLKDLVKKAYSILDKAVKKKIFHKNKASRLKSQITKLVKTAK